MRASEAEQSKGWREYQRHLKRASRKRYLRARLPLLGLYGAAGFILVGAVFLSCSWIFAHLNVSGSSQPQEGEVQAAGQARDMLLHEELCDLLEPIASEFPPAQGGGYALEAEGGVLMAETCLDQRFQAYILDLLSRSLTRRAAVAAVNPVDGRVVAMASWEDGELECAGNLCLKAEFPGASLIKTVVAAAAIEARGLGPSSAIYYRGQRYTLYRSQLEKCAGEPYTHKISFERAFSKSINPVFGKIGIYELGKDLLEQYAEKFLFNTPIPMEVPLEPSSILVPEDPFGLAEIASGFNRRTLISPMHASLITAAIANGGKMMRPWLVQRVVDATGRELYHAEPQSLACSIEEETAFQIRELMQATVKQGTCREALGPLLWKRSFQGIELGAKTGTINDRRDEHKIDWVSVYALPSDGRDPLSLTVLSVHGEKLGIRSKDLARYILEYRYSS
ncbi:MAG: penicillin-binding transpeptidase domain-containing protein [Desulfobacteraceae bacterium]